MEKTSVNILGLLEAGQLVLVNQIAYKFRVNTGVSCDQSF